MRQIPVHMVLGLILVTSWLSGQGTGSDYHFRHYTTDHGLSNNSVYCFLEDDLGFIWVGTRDGLNRFDGYDFEVYDQANSNLEGPYISTLCKGSGNTIWVGTQVAGLYRYSWDRDILTPVSHLEGDSTSLSSNRVSFIVEGSDGLAWVATNGGGLNSVHRETLEVKRYELGQDCRRIKTLALDRDENLWLGTFNGLFYFNKKAGRVTRAGYARPGSTSSSDERIQSLHFDRSGRLWVGTDGGGLYYLDNDSGTLKRLQHNSPELTQSSIRKITTAPDGRLVLGTGSFGVVFLDPVTQEIQSVFFDPDEDNSLTNNSVYDVIFDRFGSMWVGNYSGGINFYNPFDRKFFPVTHVRYNPRSLSNSNVRCFYQDREGRIWIGTRGGLDLLEGSRNSFRSYSLDTGREGPVAAPVVLSILEDSRGTFWIGTFAEGISILDRNSGKVTKFRHPLDVNHTLDQAHVYDLEEDREGNIWIATLGGVYVMSHTGGDMKRYTVENSTLCSNNIRVLLRDSRGAMWMGTAQGLNRCHPGRKEFEIFLSNSGEKDEISKNHVFCLFENDNGEVWAGTEGGGIKIIDTVKNTIRQLGMEAGLPDNTINAIEKDANGCIWISTNKGLCRYQEATGQVMVFTREDGLQSDEFYPNSSLHSVEGELFFGGHRGMNRFTPAGIRINPLIPDVVFTKLFLKNQETGLSSEDTPLEKPLPLTGKLILTYRQNNISIHFAALGYINQEKYLYSYYLEGFEEDWNPFSQQRSATYTNLDRGNYLLKVMVRNNDNQPGEQVAQLGISVLPPPWATWWAYTTYFAIIIGLLLLFRYYIISWVRVKHELELEKMEKNQIHELNQMKLRFFTNISHEFRTPLTLIRGYIEKVALAVKDRNSAYALEQINRNSRRLLNLVSELMDFRKAESGLLKLKASRGDLVKYAREIKEEFDGLASAQDIDLTFQAQFPELQVWFDPGKIEKVLFNLISNSFKFTPPGGYIQITVTAEASRLGTNLRKIQPNLMREGDWAVISVADSGIGIEAKDLAHIFDRFFQVNEDEGGPVQGTGIGLAFSKRLVDIHKGELLVQSEAGKGSVFTVRLPAGSGHLIGEELIETEKERFYLRLDYRSILSETFGQEPIPKLEEELLPGRTSVLIIEDEAQVLHLMKDCLSAHYNVIFALEGRSGLEMIRERHPDVVVTDIMMPGVSGIEVCQRIRNNPETSHIPVVMLTAKTDEETHVEGLSTGADAYLTKPFSARLLIATIDNILASRLHLKEKFAAMETIAPSALTRNKIDEEFLARVIAYIESNMATSQLDVTGLCTQIGMSRSVLYRKIKALTGHSIQEFIRGVKLRKAKYLLTHTGKSVSEVSYMVGFSNTKHFSRTFKQEFDISPSRFRK